MEPMTTENTEERECNDQSISFEDEEKNHKDLSANLSRMYDNWDVRNSEDIAYLS